MATQTAKTCHTSGSSGVLSPTPLRTILPLINTLEIHSKSKREDDGENHFRPRSQFTTMSILIVVRTRKILLGLNLLLINPDSPLMLIMSVFLSESQRLSLPANHDDGSGSACLSEPRDI
ncbi:hypothetical protein Tco_0387584 [Tanacetum coccineum]